MIAVIRFPGSNCDEDARWALQQLGGEAKLVWHREARLDQVDAVVLPGGFSYGDYLRSGAMAAQSPVMEAVREFAGQGGPVLGICNGFQVLAESGLLPGALARNSNPHFLCRTVKVRVERDDLEFTRGYRRGQVLELPIAHAEGSYYADDDTLAALEERGGVVFRYCGADGEVEDEANCSGSAEPNAIGAVESGRNGGAGPGRAGNTGSGRNPNGSLRAIAGIVNERGNVLGMMPHPERAVEGQIGGADGRPLLSSLLGSLAAHAEAGRAGLPAFSA